MPESTHDRDPPGPPPPGSARDALGFALQVEGDRAALLLRDRRFFGWLTVERLELDIPGVQFPIDAAGGAARFQRRRCRARRALLALDDAGLDAMLRARAQALGAAGFEDVRARIVDGAIVISGRVRADERSAEFVTRAWLWPHGRVLRVACAPFALFGPLHKPAASCAHDLLIALAGATMPSDEPGEPGAAYVRGLAEIDLEPLAGVLWRALPPAGWRLPDLAGVQVAAVELVRGKLEITIAGPADGATSAGAASAERARRAAASPCPPADGRLQRGDLDGAIGLLRAELARGGGDDPALSERLLGVLTAREATLREAEELARAVLARHAELVPAHLALARAAAERGQAAAAADHYTRALEAADAARDEDAALAAALAAARLHAEADARRATPLYERVLERRPGHGEAAEALFERYQAEERWSDLAKLLRKRISGGGGGGGGGAGLERRELAREHVRLGELLLTRLNDAERARDELERAVRLADGDPRAWEQLARAHATLGDTAAAVRALDKLAELLAARGDAAAEARTHARVAELWTASGDHDNAYARLRRAAELDASDPGVLARLAALAEKRGKLDEAIGAWTRLVALAGDEPEQRRRARRELARLHLAAGAPEQARAALAAGDGASNDDVDTLALSAAIDEKQGKGADAVETLTRAATLAPDAGRRAELLLRLARLLGPLGRGDDALAAYGEAHEIAADRPAGQEAARALALAARAREDAAGEAEWLDRILANESDAPDLAELAIRRAELHLGTGDAAAARALLEPALAQAGEPRRARLALADALGRLGDHAGRAAMLDAAAEDTRNTTDRARLLAAASEARLASGDAQGALAQARRASALAPDDVSARTALGEAAWRARAWDDVIAAYDALLPRLEAASRAEIARRLGSALAERGRERDAVSAFKIAVDTREAAGEPLATAYRKLAELHERMGDAGAAASALAGAATDTRTGEGPGVRAAEHYKAGELLRKKLHDPVAAVAAFEAALRLDAEHLPALDALEAVHAENGDHERVAVILGRKVAATARHPERRKALLVRLAELQAGPLKRPEAAREAYRRALEIDPEFRPALRALAPDALERGDDAEARSMFSRLLASAGTDVNERVEAALALARLDQRADRLADAVSGLRQALVLAPERDDVLELLEDTLAAAGRFAEVVEVLSRRIALAPDAAARITLEARRISVLAEQLGDHRGALDACLEALRRAPGDRRLHQRREACARVLDLPGDLGAALDALGDHTGAAWEYRRALERDPIDAEAGAALLALLERDARAIPPSGRLEFLSAAVRATPTPGLPALRELARLARATADEHARARARFALDQAADGAPPDAVLIRERAELAALSEDFGACAVRLEELGAALPATTDDERHHLAELWTELADLYERRLSQWTDARAALRKGAQVAPDGPKKRALLRQWAGYAAEAGADDEAIDALEGLPDDARVSSDWVALARAYLRAGRVREAAQSFEAAGSRSALTDDEALELFSLYRRLDEQAKLASALERSAARAEPKVGLQRLREALALYTGTLADAEAAERVRAALHALERSSISEPAELSQALTAHARRLAEAGQPLDHDGRELLARLGIAARASHNYAPLAEGLLVAAAVEPDAARSTAWLIEAAAVRRAHLGDAAGAADALARALAISPTDATVARDLDALLRELGDFARLLDMHELRLRHLVGAERAPVLVELGRIWANAFGEPARAAASFAAALEHDPTRVDLLIALADYHAREGGEPAVAEDYYRRALAADAVNAEDRAGVRARLGELLLGRGHARAAAVELGAALAEHAPDPRVQGLYEHALRQADEWDALLTLLIAHGQAPGVSVAEQLRALREAAALLDGPLGRSPEAAPIYDAILRLDPGDELARARAGAIDDALRAPAGALELAAGRADEDSAQPDAAIAHYENAWAEAGLPAALDALWQIAIAREDWEYLAELYGRRLLLAGDDREARALLWVERARLYKDKLRREPEAYRCLKEAVACNPRDADASSTLRSLAYARGEWPLAAELLYREIEAQPDPVERAGLHVELAMIYEERLHDLESALRNHETARALDPEGPVPPRALARLYALTRRFPEAARAEELSAAGAPDAHTCAERLARAASLWEQAGRADEAARCYRAASEVEGGGDAALAAASKLARLEGGQAESPAQLRARLEARLANTGNADDRLDLLRRLLAAAVASGDDAEADKRAQEVLAREPSDSTAFLERRRVLTAREDWMALAPLLRARADAVDDSSERASWLFELGRLYAARLRDQPRAAMSFEEALRADPGHASALDALADMAYRQHDWERARTLYRRLSEHASTLGADVVWYRRGELAEAMGHEVEAEAAYRRAVEENPGHLMALESIARLALFRGELTTGIAALEKVLEALPLDDVERLTALRHQLGELCNKTGDSTAARRYFELVLAEDPGRISVLGPMSELYANSGEWDRAADALGRLASHVSAPERRADLLYRMGEIYRIHLGDEDRASDAYLKAIDLDENHVPTLRRLCDYYWSNDDLTGLAEVAGELDARGALCGPDTSNETLARVAVASALANDEKRAAAVAHYLGAAGAGTIAAALADARKRRPEMEARIVAAGQKLCQGTGPSLDAVRAVLAARGPKDPAAMALAKKL